MGEYTRIYNRFTGYTVEDCDCRYCRYYGGKRTGCMRKYCCCLPERLQAMVREIKENRREMA